MADRRAQSALVCVCVVRVHRDAIIISTAFFDAYISLAAALPIQQVVDQSKIKGETRTTFKSTNH